MPLQVNATLTAVTGASAATGGRDDWDESPGLPTIDAPSKWTGSEDAYLLERRRNVWTPDGIDVVDERALIIDSDLAVTIGIDTDDVLTFTGPTGATYTARAASVAVRVAQAAGAPQRVANGLQTTRIDLTPA